MKPMSDGLLIRAAASCGRDLVTADKMWMQFAGREARELFWHRPPELRWWVRNCLADGVRRARKYGRAA